MDGRLNKPIADYLNEKGLPEVHDLISIPGGPKDLIDDEDGEKGLFRAISDVAIFLHKIENILLVQHTDCGAYGGREKCGGDERSDFHFHLDQLHLAEKAIKNAFPQLNVSSILIHFLDDEQIQLFRVS